MIAGAQAIKVRTVVALLDPYGGEDRQSARRSVSRFDDDPFRVGRGVRADAREPSAYRMRFTANVFPPSASLTYRPQYGVGV